MSIDYKLIADSDSGSDLEQEYNSLASLTTPVSKGSYKVTDLMIASSLGVTRTVSFLAGLDQAVAAGDLPSIVLDWLKKDGIDINHPDTSASLNYLVSKSHIGNTDVEEILALGSEQQYVFPGLKPATWLMLARCAKKVGFK